MASNKRNTLPDLVVRYLWVEFLNPGDGIVFGATVNKGLNGIQWENLAKTAATTAKFTINDLGFPVNKKDLCDAEALWEKEIDSLQIIRGAYLKSATPGGYRSEIAYPNFISTSGVKNELHSPSLPIGLDFGQPAFASPDIYIVSGHGGCGDVWGRTKPPDGKNPRDLGYFTLRLINFPELRLLIVPACTQAAYSRGEDWKIVFEKTGCFAMLGFDGKYLGDDPGANAFHRFAEKLQLGENIISAWKSACKGLYWGAFYREGVENLNLLKLMKAEKSEYKGKSIRHCSFESEPRNYRSPQVFGYFVHYECNVPESSFDNFCELERKRGFIEIIQENEKKSYNAFSSPDWHFFIRHAESENFKKGDFLNIRFYLMRPDHPDEFSANTFIASQDSKSWRSWKDTATANISGSREDILQIEVLQDCAYIALPITFKLNPHAAIKPMLDGSMNTFVSYSLIIGKRNINDIDNKGVWSGNSAIDLRMLSFRFKG